ncbi:hypothetical protein [Streptomyces sp. IBSBF 3136]|uniref:hypothetical protein n=1 Tax=Streptomyces sp. IBSBF 3136 TaxID=2903524 RepID=UPI002FDC596E
MEAMEGRGSGEVVHATDYCKNLSQWQWVVPAFCCDAVQAPLQVNQAGWVNFELVNEALSSYGVLADFDAYEFIAGVVDASLGIAKDQCGNRIRSGRSFGDRQWQGGSIRGNTYPESEAIAVGVLHAGAALNGRVVCLQRGYGGLRAVEEPARDSIARLGRSCADGIEAHRAVQRFGL